LDSGSAHAVSFTFKVPAGVDEKRYVLSMSIYYDYDEDGGNYETYYDRQSDETFDVLLDVSGNCVLVPKATVAAEVETGGKAGEQLVVKSTITNTDSTAKTFTITADSFEGWATLESVSPKTLTLEAGKSAEVRLTFNVDSAASGENQFNIILDSDGKTLTQPAEVLIEKSGFSLTGDVLKGNGLIWAIGILNVVLIVVIVSVAVRLVRRK